MIDWVTCEIPLLHMPINSGMVVKFKPDGQIEWSTRCGLRVTGSHDSSVQVRSVGGSGDGRPTHLKFSGNPSKFLQGHNVFGSDDIVSLMSDTIQIITQQLGLTPNLQEAEAIRAGRYPISMVDINYSYELPTRSDVRSWIRAAEFKSKTRHGRSQLKGNTLYWGKNSTRWAVKVYSKGDEIEASGHKLPEEFEETPIKKWADNKLRFELRLKRKQLINEEIRLVSDLNIDTVQRLFNAYTEKIEMSGQITLSTKQLLTLPQRLQTTYVLWKEGHDLRALQSKATYYRHRKALLEYGIDIAIACDKAPQHAANVVPLVRILEAKQAAIPDWAFDLKLIHSSAR